MSIEALDEFANASAGPPPAPSRPPAAEASGEQASIALDLGATSGSPLETGGEAPPATASRIPGGVLMLVIVLAVAGAALFAMRLTGSVAQRDGAVQAAELQIEQALATLTGQAAPQPGTAAEDAPLQTTEQVIARFADDPTDKQVDLDHLRKNPFALRLAARTSTQTAGHADAPASGVDMADQLRAKKLRAEVDRRQLQTVMHGRVPLAMVDGQVVREGDTLGSFRVAAIEQMAIVLDAEGNTYRLSMEQPQLGH